MSSKSASNRGHSAWDTLGIYTLGITGGIGSGKSYVARRLTARGIPVYDTDSQAKSLYDTDAELRQAMIELCGSSIYTASGAFDRKALAAQIFADHALLEQVNSLVHPAVRRDFCRWRESLSASGLRICALESALLLGAGLETYVDDVVVVLADDALRLQRAMQRDGVSEEAVRARMQHQMPQEELACHGDFLIYNDEMHPLESQLDQLLARIPLLSHSVAIPPNISTFASTKEGSQPFAQIR